MAEVMLGAGFDRAEPDRVVLAVAVDRNGTPGERAVVEVGNYCYPDEEARVCHVVRTDAFTERHLENGVLTVDFMVFPSPAIEDGSIDPALFPERSSREPLAIRVLRVTGTTSHTELPDETLVYLTPLDELTEEDEPLIFAPPPGD